MPANEKSLSLLFRKAESRDLPAAEALHDECFAHHPSLFAQAHREMEEAVDNPDWKFTIAEDSDGHIAGLTLVNCAPNIPGSIHVEFLAVSRDFRRHGLGRSLMEQAEAAGQQKNADFITLSVSVINDPAKALYRSMDYSLYGRQENYYPDGSTGLGLMKNLH